MFWRIVWRLLYASKARLAVAFIAIASGATVCAALLNLQIDAEQKLTHEFRALGANVVISALRTRQANDAQLLDAGVVDRIKTVNNPYSISMAPFLYVTARVTELGAAANLAGMKNLPSSEAPPKSNSSATARTAATGQDTAVILSGTRLNDLEKIAPAWKIVKASNAELISQTPCFLGTKAAEQLAVKLGNVLQLNFGDRQTNCNVAAIVTAGGPEDSQIFIELPVAQKLAGLPERISVVQLSIPGTPEEIQTYVARLAQTLPDADVRPVRALAEAEGRLLRKIQGLILATVVLILALTTLCILATMAALAMERRHDVGLMKALGGSIQRIMKLFLFEAGVLGLAGGVLGCAAGMALSPWIGERVFGVALSPRLAVVPITAGLMIVVSIVGAFPLRLLARVRPAVIFRGEA